MSKLIRLNGRPEVLSGIHGLVAQLLLNAQQLHRDHSSNEKEHSVGVETDQSGMILGNMSRAVFDCQSCSHKKRQMEINIWEKETDIHDHNPFGG